ncbi:MAG: GtrA family protein [Faecalibacterium sp.]|jgi:putative flippase GtrA|nr:GtrA family protein [Faecalibacterium sp.]
MIGWVKQMYRKYEEVISYLFFGVLATVVNIVTYALCANLWGMDTFWATTVAWVAGVLFAYGTNRTWVFRSKTKGMAAVKEFFLFVGCRLITYFTDVLFMLAAVDWFGAAYVPAEYAALWGLAAKVASNVIVVILNYIFSKLLIFAKKTEKK